MTVKFAHCLFEQSGTFKEAFKKLGVPAWDYDILDDFGCTDFQCDLFSQIELAYNEMPSVLDGISEDDLIFAFFPCTYFCGNNTMFFDGTNRAWKYMTMIERIDKIIARSEERQRLYVLLLKLCAVVERRQLKMIVENPYNAHHYWRFNFPYKPAIIDMNRRISGDYYNKPTQYLFINCVPLGGKSIQIDKQVRYVSKQVTVNRSMISSDYAHNFICDKILGIDSGHTIPTLF